MAAVDGLLGVVLAEGADGLELAEGKIPELMKAGQMKPLSMPALRPDLLRRFIDEVRSAGDGRRYVLEARGQRATFEVAIDDSGRIEFRRAGAPPVAPTPAPPSVAASGGAEIAPEAVAEPLAAAGAPALAAVEPAGGVGAAAVLVGKAVAAQATDLFLSSVADARMRVGDVLQELPGTLASEATLIELASLSEHQRARLDQHGSVDVALDIGGARVRVNLFRHRRGLGAAIRPIRRIRSLVELGLPKDLESLTELPAGLVLLVGPTGSGKSSTLAALLQHLNQTVSRHILTIEDPVEFEYESGRCLVHQREVGRDVESFAAGLRAALRESPDVILVGEMRDRETFAAALTAAETGHLVFSTLHSGSAAMAIDRIIDSFPAHQQSQVRNQLAGSLRAIVTQVLLPSVEPGGVVPATERMLVTHAVAHAIRDARGHQIGDFIQTGRAEGMVTLETSLADLVRRGRVTVATARAAARHPDILRELLAT